MAEKQVEQREHVVIRFAGDSGDGMQLTGDRFTNETARLGNDLSTLPNFPAEIRAPQGTLPGVSSYQLHFSSQDVLTPGDAPDVLVAMNPAALKANLKDIPPGGTLIIDSDEFTKRSLAKVGYTTNPLEDDSLDQWQVHAIPLTSITVEALRDYDLTRKEKERSKNMFALGLLSWLYQRTLESTTAFLKAKFATKPTILEANLAALKAGWNFGETTETFSIRYEVAPASAIPGTYRNITGNTATAYGLALGAHRTGLPLVLGSYPITPASDILHVLSGLKRYGVATVQAEDEIAGAGVALGASFGGHLGVTTTSGPGLSLKSETIGLAVSTELPLVIVDVQRGGPSTGLPTKTEQADLLQAMYGRNGESPVAIVAAQSPSDCFAAAVETVRIATQYRTPAILLTDGYLANGSEPWRIPDIDDLPDMTVEFATEPNATDAKGNPTFHPFQRDPQTLARPWAIPGTPGLTHRIGGIEKANGSGEINYTPDNHDTMVRLRATKIERIADTIEDLTVYDPSGKAELLIIGWGSTYGPIRAAVNRMQSEGMAIAHAHLRHINPLPTNTGDILRSYKRVIMPEMNLGQMATILRARYLIDIHSHTQVNGLPFTSADLIEHFTQALAELGQPAAEYRTHLNDTQA
ncbi:2-oxoacid:acceptor oxidoreductase subunit alpha [Dermatophilus congolensis]|nr:2-oxoacid:acceptor oxidoreductase subunit alpha [Dermatophilus congolensis]MBO3143229.1 2-oxoacid:acceptor oxidoreductase subunit alpha [Dermatophilus congolensis]MBO3152213.1 2-oxoacid:acceptor oxidoreductase subunit alpha [Dermatophilus congolensis]MBO3160774.1 2-oxoacid:acceptor oxidoreductase subunit alpha [Dermatophilus congolensis]MBO3163504.1 2-oxoacid:acceptor oxidoreductase subunit alpha [Dermatophilus congolensis]MBO3177050.1 2-oxoacid:acceptor oxidoreductase subunit alpha [Dermat